MRGEPGIGKTALLAEICSGARSAGALVLHCEPGEHEADLALAGLGDLLAEVAPALAADLPAPQRRALASALLLADHEGPPLDPRVLGVAVLTMLRKLCSAQRVLIAVDDVQWLDIASAQALEFALRRTTGPGLAVLFSTRLAPEDPLPIDVERIAGGMTELRLGPVSVSVLFRLLRDRIGLELSRPQLLRLHDACGGNPLHALVIGRELEEGRLHISPGAPVPLPESLRALVESRLRRLPSRTREVLAAAGSLSRATLDVLERALEPAVVERAIEAAERAGIAELEHDEVRFTHPLFASASYASTTGTARRRIHRALAAAIDDPEEQARHLALGSARRDETAAHGLELAAEQAARRGAPGAAAELADLAVELTPRVRDSDRVRRTLLSARLHTTAGDLKRARTLGRALLTELPPGPLRAEAEATVAVTLEGDLGQMTAMLESALREPGIGDGLRARLLARLAEALLRRGNAREALEPARLGLELALRLDDTRIALGLVAHLAMVEFWTGETGPGALLDMSGRGPLIEWTEVERRSGLVLSFSDSPRAALAMRLMHLGAMDESRRLLVEVLSGTDATGDEQTHVRALWQLAAVEDYTGNWQQSAAMVRDAADLEQQLGLESGAVGFARAGHAAAEGRVEDTERLVRESVAAAREAGDVPYELLTLGVLGFLRISQGDAAAALDVLLPVIERAQQISEPRVNRYWPDTVEALVAVGDIDRARRCLDLYASEARRLGVPRSLARAAHCRGVLLSSCGEHEAAVAAFEESIAIHERCPNVFEHARTLLAHGVALRRARHRGAARTSIVEALSIFERLPSPLWAERARGELARTGLRRRTGNELSETEQFVARLAAQGLTNREIGQRASLTPKSVEDVLRRIYRQLDVRNKAQLAALITHDADRR